MRGCGSGDLGRGPEAAGAGAGAGNWLGCEWRQRRPGPRPGRGARGSHYPSAWTSGLKSCQRLPPAAGFTGGETEAGRGRWSAKSCEAADRWG